MTPSVGELEIWLRRSRPYGYDVELRSTGPNEDTDVRNATLAALTDESIAVLQAMDERSEEYGRGLYNALLSNAELLAAFRSAATLAESKRAPLRIRLFVDAAAPDLHQLRWEAMRDPVSGALLFTGDRVFFSRYIATPVYRSLGRRPKEPLRALAVISSPSDIKQWRAAGRTLTELEPDEEESRIREAFQGIVVEVLRSAPAGGTPVGLQAISTALEAVRYDILYLVCHGSLDEREPILWLEGEGGEAERVKGKDFVDRVAELANRPSLVVLASCKSAGEGDEATSEDAGVLAALGPRLAAAGVPAVLAMQGNVTLGTVRRFMPVFFRELAEDGQIDRAATLARGATRERSDAWVPILFMRLKGGGLWSEQVGFVGRDGASGGFEQWPELIGAIRGKTCTPILGPGLVEAVVGSRRELALALADAWNVPLAQQDRDELPQVAQYLAVRRSRTFLEREVLQKSGERMQARHPDALTEELRAPLGGVEDALLPARLGALFRAVGKARAGVLDPEPHEALAELPFPLYLSTNFDPLMEDALVERKRVPVVEVCRWTPRIPTRPSRFAENPDYRPTVEAPLVYHLFGHTGVERSLVLTQDDYLDALIAATRHDRLPQLIRTALTDRALLFLGFQIDDWNFRVLFRFLMNLEGSDMLEYHPHVAVQIDPEEQRFRNPRAARNYLDQYFGHGAARVNIYWGSAEDFVRELLGQYRKASI
jgi:hypothetical protein